MTHYQKALVSVLSVSLFTVGSSAFAVSPAPVNLNTAGKFAVLAGSGVTNNRVSTILGDVGVSPSGKATIVGLSADEVTGKIYAADDSTTGVAPMLTQAKNDIATAYSDAAGRTADAIPLSGNIGGKTLAPGLYTSTGALEISSGDLILDGKGDPNAAWIFQVGTTLTTAQGRIINLSGGAQPQNVFWSVGGSATIGSGNVFRGIILAEQSITLGQIARLDGRAFAKNGGVTLAYNFINPADPPPTPVVTSAQPAISTPAATIPTPVVLPAQTTITPQTATASAEDQISALLAQLVALQKLVNESAPPTPPKAEVAAPAKSVGDIMQLQMFLNTHGFIVAESGPGSPGNETNKLGALTKKALCNFQVDKGIVPSEKNRACGVYGPKTRKAIRDANS